MGYWDYYRGPRTQEPKTPDEAIARKTKSAQAKLDNGNTYPSARTSEPRRGPQVLHVTPLKAYIDPNS